MTKVQEIVSQAESLPAGDRLKIADLLLQTVYKTEPGIDREWIEIAHRRNQELESGEVQGIPWEDVLDEIRRDFGA